jgi:hypothetical protein
MVKKLRNCLTLDDGTDSLSRNLGNYQPINQRCSKSQQSKYLDCLYSLRVFVDLLICPMRLEVFNYILMSKKRTDSTVKSSNE